MLYLIDHENTGDAGLNGIKMLTKEDRVVIFYGATESKINIEIFAQISNSKAKVKVYRSEKISKNYLDFWLSTYVGYAIGKKKVENITIISKDHGYDAVIDFWGQNGIQISRQDSILAGSILETQIGSEIKEALKEDLLPQTEYPSIYSAIMKNNTAISYNNSLAKLYGSQRAGELYRKTKGVFIKHLESNKTKAA